MPDRPKRGLAAPQAVAAWTRRAYSRTPLRVKLIAAMLLLVTAALAGSGAVAATKLRSYLIGRVDAQLAAAQQPIGEHHGGPDQDDHGAGPSRLPSAYVAEVTDANGAVVSGPTSNLVDPHEPLPALPHPTGAQTQAMGPHTFTVGAVTGDGRWRVLATPIALSDGSAGTQLVAQSLSDVQNTVSQLITLFMIIGAAAVVVLAGVGYFLIRASLRPLRDVERTAAMIAAGDLSHRVPDADPRTEVGQLSGALNAMLAKIETAFAQRAASEDAARRSEERMRRSEAAARRSEERMRRFVADASHELRTPLTSIRGYAELYRQGAATDDTDVRQWMSRIEDEAHRMGVLVEDLLLLARLDQERPLAQSPVDMLALAGNAVHDARVLDPSRPITLEVGQSDPPPIVIGDETRLEQVVANLVGNALRHTPPATPIIVRVSSRVDQHVGRGRVVLAVADEGPGMTPDEAARVFERFYRADQSRSRNGGTGLGLAIVAALVAGHGGTVDVETSPGSGCCFRVEIPLAAVPAAPVPAASS